MSIYLKKARPSNDKWEKLLYKLELLIDRLDRILRKVRT